MTNSVAIKHDDALTRAQMFLGIAGMVLRHKGYDSLARDLEATSRVLCPSDVATALSQAALWLEMYAGASVEGDHLITF